MQGFANRHLEVPPTTLREHDEAQAAKLAEPKYDTATTVNVHLHDGEIHVVHKAAAWVRLGNVTVFPDDEQSCREIAKAFTILANAIRHSEQVDEFVHQRP